MIKKINKQVKKNSVKQKKTIGMTPKNRLLKSLRFIKINKIQRNKFKKLKMFLASVRRKRPPFKFIKYTNKYVYKKFLPKYQFSLVFQNKNKKKVKGAITPKLYLKNLLEVVIALKKRIIKKKKKKFGLKKRKKRYYIWRRKKGYRFRRGGYFYVKKRRNKFKRIKRLNQRIFLFKATGYNKFKRKGRLLNIVKRKKQKAKVKELAKLKRKFKKTSNETLEIEPLNLIGAKYRTYKKNKRNKTSFLHKFKKVLKVLDLIKIGNTTPGNFKKQSRFFFLKTVVPGIIKTPYELYSRYPTSVRNLFKGMRQAKKIKQIKNLWNKIANILFLKCIASSIRHNNLNQLYKEKVKEVKNHNYQVGIQRQRNSLRILTLNIAKKRDHNKKIGKILEKQKFVQSEFTPLNEINLDNKKVVFKANLDYYLNSKMTGNIKTTVLKSYLRKNKLTKKVKKSIKKKVGAKSQNIKEIVTVVKPVVKKARNKVKRKKSDKKISVKAFNILLQNIKVATPKISNKLRKKSKVKVVGLSVGPKVGKRLAKTTNLKIWRAKLFNTLKEPVRKIFKENKKYYKRLAKKIKQANKKKLKKVKKIKQKPRQTKLVKGNKITKIKPKSKKFKINWLKKKVIKKYKKKRKTKRGRKNTEKRRRLSKVAHFIRPRIINQKELQAYVTHCKERCVLFNSLKVAKQKKVRLVKKVFTKQKKQKLLKYLLTKYFVNQKKEAILLKLKIINITKYLNNKGSRYLTGAVNNFIQEYVNTFYHLVARKNVRRKIIEKKIIKAVKKQKKGTIVAFIKAQGSRSVKNRVKIEKLKNWIKLNSVAKFYGNKKKNKKRLKPRARKLALRNLVNGRASTITKSKWNLKKADRLFLEALRRRGIKGAQTKFYYSYKKKKTRINRSKYISRKILKAHKKAKKRGRKIKKNLIKASYYYYFKRLRYDRVLLDKLNFKQKELNMSIQNKIKLSKFLLYLLMRVYVKKTQFKRTNVRKGLRKIKKLTKKQKITKKIKILGVLLESFTKPVRRRSKKYIGVIKKTVIVKVLIKLLRSLLKSTEGDIRERSKRSKIKEIIKIFLYPLLINKRQIKKVRLRKKNKIYLIMAQIFLYNIKQIVKSQEYSINFFGIIGSSVTAEYVLRRLKERLENVKGKGTGFWLIPKAMNRLMNSKHVVGFKMKFSGRLTGNSMAQQSIMKKGIIGNSNMNVYIDYAQDNIIRKHGKCGIKLWIVRNLITYMPYKYVYTYNFKG